jgi:histidinol-phosphatase (PHP family)
VTLTDYHVHLRPDDEGTAAFEYFTEKNVARYVERAREAGIGELGFSEHVYRFREALDVWRHPFWVEQAVDRLDDYVGFLLEMRAAGYPVKVGLEVDYVPGRERELAALLEGRPFDYVIGSVHFIADRAVDHEGYDAWRESEPEQVWQEYFEAVGGAAASGLFDVLAHLDLVKVWGPGRPAPSAPLTNYYNLAMHAIADADVAIEVSTAGLRKPVGELYPSKELLRQCLSAGKPIALSSDAHVPEHLGYAYETAVEALRAAGVEELAVFDRRARRLEPLG